MRFISGIGLLLLLTACAGEAAPPPEMTNAERGQIQVEVLAWADQGPSNVVFHIVQTGPAHEWRGWDIVPLVEAAFFELAPNELFDLGVLDAEHALFDQADGHFMDGSSYLATWDQFLTGTQERYGGWESWDAEWGTRRIDVLAPDIALFVGEASGLLRLRDGGEFDFLTNFSFVLRKKDGVWTGLFGQVAGSRTPRE